MNNNRQLLLSLPLYFLMATLRKFLSWVGVGIMSQHHKGVDMISYYDGYEKHTILIKRQRGPRPYYSIHDQDTGIDITKIIEKYAGPYYNFHGVATNPDMMNLGTIRIRSIRGEKVVERFTPISFN
jgi:hypothetical protein